MLAGCVASESWDMVAAGWRQSIVFSMEWPNLRVERSFWTVERRELKLKSWDKNRRPWLPFDHAQASRMRRTKAGER